MLPKKKKRREERGKEIKKVRPGKATNNEPEKRVMSRLKPDINSAQRQHFNLHVYKADSAKPISFYVYDSKRKIAWKLPSL